MDGIHVSVRLGEDPKVCLLIVIGVREDGEKELLAVEDGYRESTESWAGVFRDMKRRGLNEPKLVVGDGALGAWAALRDVYPGAGEQRCWFHASGNIIDCLPKRLHSRAKGLLSEIIEAPTRKDARAALEVFREEYGASTPRRWPSSTATGRSSPRSTTTRRAASLIHLLAVRAKRGICGHERTHRETAAPAQSAAKSS